MRSLTASVTTEKNKLLGKKTCTLLEIDASSTLYYSDRAITISGQDYTAKIMKWAPIVSQLTPGEEVVRTSAVSFELSNVPDIHGLFNLNQEVRLYYCAEGLTSADKVPLFTGIIAGEIVADTESGTVKFTALGMGKKFNKLVGDPYTVAEFADIDPDYINTTIQHLIGVGSNHECVPIVAGAMSTLREEFIPGNTSIKLTSATSPIAFPSSGTVIIGEEEYAYTGISTNDLTGVSSPSIGYAAGSPVLEKVTLKYSAGKSYSDTPVKAITNVRVLPFDTTDLAKSVAVDSSLYTVNLNELIGSLRYATITLTDVAAIRKQITLQTSTSDPLHQHLGTGTPSSVDRRANAYSVISGAVNNPTYAYDNSKGDTTTYANINASSNIQYNIDASSPPSGTITKVTFNFYAACTWFGCSLYAGGNYYDINPYIGWKSIEVSITSWSDMWGQFITPAGKVIQLYDFYATVDYTTAALTSSNATSMVITTTGNSVADFIGGTVIVDYEGYKDDGSGTYTGTASLLINEPTAVFKFLIIKNSNGATASDINLTGYATTKATLAAFSASYALDFAIREQIDLEVLLAQLAQQCWCRHYWGADGKAELDVIPTGGTSIKSLDLDDTDLILDSDESPKSIKKMIPGIDDVFNAPEICYNYNPVLGTWTSADSYQGNYKPSADATSEGLYGVRKRPPYLFYAVRSSAMATNLGNKLQARYKYPFPEVTFRTWLRNLELEIGDLIKIDADQLSFEGALCEILEINHIPPMPIDGQGSDIWLKLMYLLFSAFSLTDTASVSDSKIIDINMPLPESSTASDSSIVDIAMPLTDAATAGDTAIVDIDLIPMNDPLSSLWDSNLISVWHMDNDFTDAKDSNNGTGVGSPTFGTGKVEQSVILDGSTQYITLGTPANLSVGITNFTLIAWVKLTELGLENKALTIFSNEVFEASGFTCRVDDYISPTNRGRVTVRTSQSGASTQVSTTTLIPNDQDWHHLVIIKDGTALKVLIDGVLATIGSGTLTNPVDATAVCTIGKEPGWSNTEFEGSLDEVAFFNDALTTAEAQALYTQYIQYETQEQIYVGDVLTLIRNLYFFDSTRQYDSSKQFNSAP